MGSHFVAVYVCDLEILGHYIGVSESSKVQDILERLRPRCHDEGQMKALDKVVRKIYKADPETGESADGHDLIRAFRLICEEHLGEQESLEVYEDPDETPTLWKFIFEGEAPFEIPLSPYGNPAVSWHSPKHATAILDLFKRELEEKRFKKGFLGEEELKSIVQKLSSAQSGNQGALVFYEQ